MVRLAGLVPLAPVAALALSACSSSDAQVPFDDGKGSAAAAGLGELRAEYPAAPYGSRTGAVIENFRFLGWHSPKASSYDTTKLEAVNLGQFYDPTGERGVKLLVMTSTAVWCSACKQEYKDMAANVATYEAKGVRFLGALFQDASMPSPKPSKPSDLVLWAKTFDVTFPFVLDPDLKLGSFFDVEATPMEMIVDAKTMEILGITEGWVSKGDGSLWSELDTWLASR
jgi:hypothetical protein